jgi:hypothetical protein
MGEDLADLIGNLSIGEFVYDQTTVECTDLGLFMQWQRMSSIAPIYPFCDDQDSNFKI